MPRLKPLISLLAVLCGGALCSCHSVLRVEIPRVETKLSSSEKRHLATLLDSVAEGWDGEQFSLAHSRGKAAARGDKAFADFLEEWNAKQCPRYWQSGTIFASRHGAYEVELATQTNPHEEVPPTQIDQLIKASRVKSHGDDTLAERSGLGVPMVGHIFRTNATRKDLPFLPPNGGNLTLTAIMEMGEDDHDPATPRRCRLRLINALNVERVKLANSEPQLAANFTAAKDRALSKKSLGLFSWLGLFYPERTLADCHLYCMDVYDPKRIPVVFVHGLMSDPHIWLNAVNAISSDPELRARYQPWYFLYPTGMAVPQTSARLRASLQQARDYFDPDHNDPGMNQMVLVGHSMGGLLSRMQTIDPQDKIWNAMFSKPPEELNVTEPVRERLMTTLKFKPQTEVKRAIFITTPHRGSNIASMNIVRRLASLIRLPVDTLIMSEQLLTGNLDALNPQIRDWGFFAFLSLGTLSNDHPFYEGLNSVPIRVPYHSIIGHVGKAPLQESSDGAVPYWSAHLEGAKSEKVVSYWHGCTERPEVVEEVVRVLKEHLREGKK